MTKAVKASVEIWVKTFEWNELKTKIMRYFLNIPLKLFYPFFFFLRTLFYLLLVVKKEMRVYKNYYIYSIFQLYKNYLFKLSII